MDIEKMLEIELLYSQYKSLLTEKQSNIISLYYEEDYSLGEISEMLDISRQSIHDTLKRSEKAMKDYESKLKLVYKSNEFENVADEILKKADDIKQNLKNTDCEYLNLELDKIICLIKGLI